MNNPIVFIQLGGDRVRADIIESYSEDRMRNGVIVRTASHTFAAPLTLAEFEERLRKALDPTPSDPTVPYPSWTPPYPPQGGYER